MTSKCKMPPKYRKIYDKALKEVDDYFEDDDEITSKCKTCGYDEKEHLLLGLIERKFEGICKKFTPEDEFVYGSNPYSVKGNEKQKKGCGKHLTENKIWYCGESCGCCGIHLCPSCSKSEATVDYESEQTPNTSGTFNLSDEIVDFGIYNFIPTDKVKTFIAQIKKEIFYNDYHDEPRFRLGEKIDKLAGDKLI